MNSNKFATSFALTEKVEIIVPYTVGSAHLYSNEVYVKHAMRTLATEFGGASVIEQRGAWVSEGTNGEVGELIEERSTVVYAFAEELTDDSLNILYDLAEVLAEQMAQEAIAVTINGSMHFVSGTSVEVAV